MSDHVAATLIIHALPRQHARLVMELIEEHGLVNGEDDAEEGVVLGLPYCAHDYASGVVDDVTATLIAQAPEVSFTAWYDPFEQDLGDRRCYVHGLGLYQSACDSDGEPVYSHRQVRKAVASGRWPHAVHELLGRPWDEAIATMTPRPGNEESWMRVTPPTSYDALWDTKTGEVTVSPADAEDDDDTIELQGPKVSRRFTGLTAQEQGSRATSLIEEFLRESGWWTAAPWSTTVTRGRAGRFWETTAYRSAELTEVSA